MRPCKPNNGHIRSAEGSILSVQEWKKEKKNIRQKKRKERLSKDRTNAKKKKDKGDDAMQLETMPLQLRRSEGPGIPQDGHEGDCNLETSCCKVGEAKGAKHYSSARTKESKKVWKIKIDKEREVEFEGSMEELFQVLGQSKRL
jgi:hypothetical protein